jgi:methylglutaconyl-CoA hydratase
MRAAAEHSEADNRADAMSMAKMLKTLSQIPALTVALVESAAFGGGAGLAAACDMAIAVADTRFSFSEVKLGLTPATISPYVIDAIGPRRARALFVTAETFDAEYAERMGLVHYVVADQAGMTAMEEHIANLVFAAAPGAVADAKKLVADVTGEIIDKDLGHETARRIAARRSSDEGKEGVAAFLEKRKPSWSR